MRPTLLVFVVALGISIFTSAANADKRDDATKLVDLFVSKSTVDAMFEAMTPLLRQSLAASLSQGEASSLGSESRQFVTELFLSEFKAHFSQGMRQHYIQIYMDVLTTSELKETRAFLETPAGASFARKQAQLLRRGSRAGQTVGRAIGIKVGRMLGRRLAKDGENIITNENDLAVLRRMFPNQ